MSNSCRSAVNNQREPLWQTVLQPDLILQIEQILQETDLDNGLRLEIAGVVIENLSHYCCVLATKALGVQLQIDQLGMGYSFLSRLQCLPNLSCYEIRQIKVDRSLVSQIDVITKA